CLALAIGVGLGRLKRMAFGRAALGVAVALLAVSILPNRESASRFSYPDRELGDQQWTQAVEVLDTRIRESPPGAGVRIRNLAFPPMGGRLGEEFPGLAGIFIIAWPTNVVDGHRVRFLDQNAARLAFAARHPDTRIHELLVPANPQGVSPGTK
ncbi:MAG: hypothetical protein HRU01_21670, partial [Myxococcales bacterium]|nr:hypothetical protein [Myxococcales bacterium]